MEKEEIRNTAESCISEVLGTISYGIVPSGDDAEETEFGFHVMCGEVLCQYFIDSMKTEKPMTVMDVIDVCTEIGRILCHTDKEVEG